MFQLLARLIEFMIAVSVIRSVVNYIKRLWAGNAAYRPPFRPPNASSPAGQATDSATVLRQDPICGIYVAVDTSLKKIVAGQVYHFCSPECRAKFTA